MSLDGEHCSCDADLPAIVGLANCPIHGSIGKTEYERLQAQAQAGRTLASAAKVWRHATIGRLRLLDSRGEAMKAMLEPDRALCEALGEFECHGS